MNEIVGLLGGVLIDADAAPAHLMHHRQQVDFKPIGVARAFPLDDLLENFGHFERSHRVDLGVGADDGAPAVARCRIGLGSSC